MMTIPIDVATAQEGETWTYSYTVGAKPLGTNDISHFQLLFGDNTPVDSASCSVHFKAEISSAFIKFDSLKIKDAETVTFVLTSPNGPTWGQAIIKAGNHRETFEVLIPGSQVPEPGCAMISAVALLLALRRNRANYRN
jgi:hypothetical protein